MEHLKQASKAVSEWPEGKEEAAGISESTETAGYAFYVLYYHGGIASWRVTKTEHDLDTVDGLINWIAEKKQEKPEHCDFFLKFWKRLEA